VKVIGHRGAAGRAPENTVAGVALAFADGADAVEVDVRLAADGTPVIIHDETLDRTAGIAARVAALTSAELAGLIGGDRRIPTLAEVWDAASGRVVLELKGAWGSGEAVEAARVVADFLASRDVSAAVVSCFDPAALAAFLDAGGTARTGVITLEALDPVSNIRAAAEGGHHVCYIPGTLVTAEIVRLAHAAGKEIVAWTVNDPDVIRALAAAGADGVITDDPGAARAALAAR